MKVEVRWMKPVRKSPEEFEIWKLSASAGGRRLSYTRPIFIYSIKEIRGKRWIEGFPVCDEVDFAGVGDPVFTGEKEGLGYFFFLELFNPVVISEDLLIVKIGKIGREGVEEVEEMLEKRLWMSEKDRRIWAFRRKELKRMQVYRSNILFTVRALLTILTTREMMRKKIRILAPFPFPGFFSLSRDGEKKKNADLIPLQMRNLISVLEELRNETGGTLRFIDLALFYSFLLEGKKRRALRLLEKLDERERNAVRKFVENPEKHRKEIRKRFLSILDRLFRLLNEG